MKILQLFILIALPIYGYGSDSLKVKAQFVFSTKSSKYFSEPRFIEVEFENVSNSDIYFVAPNKEIIINGKDTTSIGGLGGKLNYREDIQNEYHLQEKETICLRKKVREIIKNRGVDFHQYSNTELFLEEYDISDSKVKMFYFLKKGEKIKNTFFISNKLEKGDYYVLISSKGYLSNFTEYLPRNFKTYKLYNGNISLESKFSFRVE